MTARQQLVSCGVSCAFALSGSPASAAAEPRDESGHAGGNRAVECAPASELGEARSAKEAQDDLQIPQAGRGQGMLTAVPEPAAILIGSIGLLALVRRRRG